MLSNLKKATDYEVQQWLVKSLDLTPYQKEKLYSLEIVRFSEFEFFKLKPKVKFHPIWRFTIIFYLLFIILLFVFLPFTFFITGRWGYGKKYLSVYENWSRRLGL